MNNITRSLIRLTLPVILLTAASAAHADDPGANNSFRIGAYFVFYHATADDLQGPYVPAGANFKFKDTQTLYLAYVRTLPANFAVELALGYPPLTKTEGRGPATLGSVPYNGQTISTARWLSPNLLLEYMFLSETSKFRPYIGAGVNYTAFYDRDNTAQGNAAAGGPTRLSLTSSVGPVGTVGIKYNLTGNWNFYSSYSITQVKSRLTADTAGVERTTRIKFGPQALVVSVGYSF